MSNMSHVRELVLVSVERGVRSKCTASCYKYSVGCCFMLPLKLEIFGAPQPRASANGLLRTLLANGARHAQP